MIVRLMNDGQYTVPDSLHDELNALDDGAVAALAEGNLEALHGYLHEMWELVRANGERLAHDELPPVSDAIVPPADLTLDEAHELLHGEGLIPDLPG